MLKGPDNWGRLAGPGSAPDEGRRDATTQGGSAKGPARRPPRDEDDGDGRAGAQPTRRLWGNPDGGTGATAKGGPARKLRRPGGTIETRLDEGRGLDGVAPPSRQGNNDAPENENN